MCHSRSPGILKIDLRRGMFPLSGGLIIRRVEGPGLPQATRQVLDAITIDQESKVRELPTKK